MSNAQVGSPVAGGAVTSVEPKVRVSLSIQYAEGNSSLERNIAISIRRNEYPLASGVEDLSVFGVSFKCFA